MGMDRLRWKSPAMVKRELMMFLIAYNRIGLLMLQSSQLHRVGSHNKPQHDRSRHCLRTYRAKSILAQVRQLRGKNGKNRWVDRRKTL